MIIVRYFAAARAAAGVGEEQRDARTLDAVLAAAVAQYGERLGTVLEVCSFLVDGDPVGARPHADVRLTDGAVVDCLPPYAGG